MLMIKAVAVFCSFTFLIFMLALATTKASNDCARVVADNAQNTSFYDQRAIALYEANALRDGSAKSFIEDFWEGLQHCPR